MTEFSYFIDGPDGSEIEAPQTPTSEHWVRIELPGGGRIDRPWRESPAPSEEAPFWTGHKLRFAQTLFTHAENVAWNAKRSDLSAMSGADLLDPENAAMAAFSVLEYWLGMSETIDTRDPSVSGGLDVFIALGVIAPERKAQILAGESPS